MAVALSSGLLFAAVPAASAATPVPKIVRFTVSPQRLPYTGGTVTLTGRVRSATMCNLAIPGNPTVDCSSGSFTTTWDVPANPGQKTRVLTAQLTAATAAGLTGPTATSRVHVIRQSWVPLPRLRGLTITPRKLGIAGGTVQIQWTNHHASSCSITVSWWGGGSYTNQWMECPLTSTATVTIPSSPYPITSAPQCFLTETLIPLDSLNLPLTRTEKGTESNKK